MARRLLISRQTVQFNLRWCVKKMLSFQTSITAFVVLTWYVIQFCTFCDLLKATINSGHISLISLDAGRSILVQYHVITHKCMRYITWSMARRHSHKSGYARQLIAFPFIIDLWSYQPRSFKWLIELQDINALLNIYKRLSALDEHTWLVLPRK